MTDSTQNSNSAPVKKAKKKKGPLRTEALVPFLIVTGILVVYFKLFFDLHLKKAIEWAGYQVVGAEVDIADLTTSFINGTFRAQGIEITDSAKPTHNLVVIGDVRFGVLWDGLLRAKVVVEEMAVEQIEIGKQRKSPGKVKPLDPAKTNDGESAVDKLKDQALDKTQEKYNNNVLGDIAAMLSGTSGEDQLKNIEGSLPSKKKLAELETVYKEKQKAWDQKIKALPQGKEIQSLGDRLSKVKTKDFKTPQELQNSIKEIESIFKEADEKYKLVSTTAKELDQDVKTVDQDIKELDAMVKKDIKDLEARFRLPKLDANSISKALFQQYMGPYLAKFNHYRDVAEQYVPPNVMKKKNGEVDEQIQPRPRAQGVSYEFGKPNAYPLVWIKKVSISSEAGASANAGDIAGLITDITTNQLLTRKPTVAKIDGNFPAQQVMGVSSLISLDNRKEKSLIDYNFKVGSYPMEGKQLISSSDVNIAFNKASGGFALTGVLEGLRDFKFNLDNAFKNIDYSIEAKNKTVDEVVKAIFAGIPVVTIDARGSGTLPNNLSFGVNSNLGPEIVKGFQAQLQKKIDEAKAKIQAYVNEQVGKEKARIEGEIAKVKGQVEGEVKKVQAQLDGEKAKANAKIDEAKKQASNDAKKKAEDQIKKALGKDGDKKLEDLKKKFKL